MMEQMQSDPQTIQGFPVSALVLQTIWKNSLTNIGQWEFSQEEIELLSLYIREGQSKKFIESCLIPFEQVFKTKGIHYFKEYSKRYGIKDFMEFHETLIGLLEKISLIKFEEDDLSLQCKTTLAIAEELLNHVCWGLYLLYQAAGIRSDFQAKNIDPDDFLFIEKAVILASQLYLSLLTKERTDISSFCEKISLLVSPLHLGFISTLASKGSRGVDGSFFRLRNSCNEIANALHALKIKDFIQKFSCDFFIAPFYSSLSCAALAYSACMDQNTDLTFSIHPYSHYEEHVRCGEWEDKKSRDILARISQIPPLIRPYAQVSGKRIFILTGNPGDGKVLRGLRNYYKELGASCVYLSCVEAPKEYGNPNRGPFKIQDMELAVAPTFFSTGPAPLRQWQKYVAEYKNER